MGRSGQVRVILREEIPNLGDAGDVVGVKPGFARNYLVPQGKAILATESKVKELEHHRRIVAEKVARELKDLVVVKQQLEKLALETQVKVGGEGKLFGSVTAANIAQLLAEKGFEIHRRKIQLSEPIKEAGDHEVPVRLHRDVIATLKLAVKSDAPPVEDEDVAERDEDVHEEVDSRDEG